MRYPSLCRATVIVALPALFVVSAPGCQRQDSIEAYSVPKPRSSIGEDSLILGEDDLITIGDEVAGQDAATQLKSDDDFLLTPLDDAEDESASGSQVIALDDVGAGLDQSAATIMGDAGAGMALLEDDVAAAEPAGGVAALAGVPQTAAAPIMQPAIPEAPYSVWNVVSLFLCIMLLSFTGMLMYDAVRQIWTWDAAHPVNSGMMQTIIDLFR